MSYTILHYYGEQKSKCGYCKNTDCSVAHGLHAFKMSAEMYQDLIDRGWRRSGLYCYKPSNHNTCCPCYTIKSDALMFKLSKSHKKVLKRMNRFLRDGIKDKDEEDETTGGMSSKNCAEDSNFGVHVEPQAPNVPIPQINLMEMEAANDTNMLNAIIKPQSPNTDNALSIASSNSAGDYKNHFDSSNPPCKKAKQMRVERRQAKLAAKGIALDSEEALRTSSKLKDNKEKTIKDFINEPRPDDKHKLKIKLIPSHTHTIQEEALTLYRKYQLTIHNDSPTRLTPDNLNRFLYKTPLKHHKSDDTPDMGYGSFHQQYWLDDKLIAVGVIDILPKCVSSVYFFYDPDYKFLSLGTYASLREIEFVQQLAEKNATLRYYYMGFYIHSCPKMRYKGKLSASYLLCPEMYTWEPLTDEMRAKLDDHKYQRLNIDALAKDPNEFKEADLDEITLLIDNSKCIKYGQYIQITGDVAERDTIVEYGKLLGRNCAHRAIYYYLN